MLVPLGAVNAISHHPDVTDEWLGLLAYSALLGLVLTIWLYVLGACRLGPAQTAVYTYPEQFFAVVAAGLLICGPVLRLQRLGGVITLDGVVRGRPRPNPVISCEGVSAAGSLGVFT
jgi:drug/metabolite transporter (DMT)-like permease